MQDPWPPKIRELQRPVANGRASNRLSSDSHTTQTRHTRRQFPLSVYSLRRHTTPDLNTPVMNTASRLPRGVTALLRQQSSQRALAKGFATTSASRWACSSCRRRIHDRTAAVVTSPISFTSRRTISASAPRWAQVSDSGPQGQQEGPKQGEPGYSAQAPSMEQVREQHKQKNRTGM